MRLPMRASALTALKARGERTAILSNGAPRMLAAAVEAAGLKDLLDAVLSVDAIGMYKPRREVYALVTEAFGVAPADVVFVSSNRWDVMGAASFGFRAFMGQSRGNAGRISGASAASGIARFE